HSRSTGNERSSSTIVSTSLSMAMLTEATSSPGSSERSSNAVASTSVDDHKVALPANTAMETDRIKVCSRVRTPASLKKRAEDLGSLRFTMVLSLCDLGLQPGCIGVRLLLGGP